MSENTEVKTTTTNIPIPVITYSIERKCDDCSIVANGTVGYPIWGISLNVYKGDHESSYGDVTMNEDFYGEVAESMIVYIPEYIKSVEWLPKTPKMRRALISAIMEIEEIMENDRGGEHIAEGYRDMKIGMHWNNTPEDVA